MTNERHVLCSVMEFTDGSSSVMELHRGTREECESLAEKIPAVCNSTSKQAACAYMALLTEQEYDEAMETPQ